MQSTAQHIIGPLQRAIRKQGWKKLSDVQDRVFRPILRGQNTVFAAQTGTGKTAGYLLPLLQQVYEKKLSDPASLLIALPTTELSHQVSQVAKVFSEEMDGIRVVSSCTEDKKGNVVIGTPQSLVNYSQRKNLDFRQLVKHIVLDECDRLFHPSMFTDTKQLFQCLPLPKKVKGGNRKGDLQSIFVSASLTRDLEHIITRFCPQSQFIDLCQGLLLPTATTHKCFEVSNRLKVPLLVYLYKRKGKLRLQGKKVLCFVRTKQRAERICEMLTQHGIRASHCSGDTEGELRGKMRAALEAGAIDMIVATDVMSRGIDMKDIDVVVNIDMPLDGKHYIHRAGRTGRVGKAGLVLSFCGVEEQHMNFGGKILALQERHLFKGIVQSIVDGKRVIRKEKIPGPFQPYVTTMDKDGEAKKREADQVALRYRSKQSDKVRAKKSSTPSLRDFKEGRYEDVLR